MARNGGSWTEGRYRSFVTSALRGAFRRWPPKFTVLKNAFVGKKENKKTKRIAAHYECAACHGHFVATEVEVDHIDPVVSVEDGFVSWDVFISRLYCEMENLQVLCKACHKHKTATERKKESVDEQEKRVAPRRRGRPTRANRA